MKKLSPAQKSLYEFIRTYRATYGFAPSVKEMMAYFEWKSSNGVHEQLRAMERKGWILCYPMAARAIAITDAERRALRERMRKEKLFVPESEEL